MKKYKVKKIHKVQLEAEVFAHSVAEAIKISTRNSDTEWKETYNKTYIDTKHTTFERVEEDQ